MGISYAAILYWRDKFYTNAQSVRPWMTMMLAAFRGTVVSLIAALLLGPILSWRQTDTIKPIVALLQDNSESIRYHWSTADSAAYFKKWQALADRLSAKYEVAPFTFGSTTQPGDRIALNEQATNLSAAIDEINDRYYNQHLGAVVMATDGIYNQGGNPVYAAAEAPYSIYTVALGDTTVPKDIRITNVLHNKIAYLNDQFSVRVEIEATHLPGAVTNLQLSEIAAGKAIVSSGKPCTITGNRDVQSFDFVVSASHPGVMHYQIMVNPVAGEITTRNNVRDIFVEVVDGRQKIALIANSPHPDVAALRQCINANKNYQLDVFYAADFAGKLNEYNLVILHQLPGQQNKAQPILQQIQDLQKPVLFIAGSQSDFNALAAAQSLVGGAVSMNRFNDVTASFNSTFSPFTISENTVDAIAKWPPLQNFFGTYKANPAAPVLLFQRINNVTTDYPLLSVSESAATRQGVLAGEGLWRWRLYNFEQHHNHEAFDELVNKVIQFLAVKGDKRPFRVNVSKNIFQDNESITLDAQLYNSNFELVNTPDVAVKVTGEDGKEYPFRMNRTENYYTLNAGFLPVGNYRLQATTKLGNNAYSAEARFSVAPLQLEELRTVADHRVLQQLSQEHHGKMFTPADMEKIADELLEKNALKPMLVDSYKTNSAIHLKWLFFLFLSLLTAEWVTRKYLGSY